MKYDKPTIDSVAATTAIKSGSKLIRIVAEVRIGDHASSGAYEADE